MRYLIERMWRLLFSEENTGSPPPHNQDGSIIVLALLVLAIMTVIGLMSSDLIITENFITRNTAIYQQNVSLIEAGAMEGLQTLMQTPDNDPDNFDVSFSNTDWLVPRSEAWTMGNWYDRDFSGRLLNANNSMAAGDIPLLAARGENGSGNMRFALVGWSAVALPGGGSQSLVVSGSGQPTVWRQGRLLAEYVSLSGGDDNGFGTLRMEIGVQRQIRIN